MLLECFDQRIHLNSVHLPPLEGVTAERPLPSEQTFSCGVVKFDFDSHRVRVSPLTPYATPAASAAAFATSAAMGVRL